MVVEDDEEIRLVLRYALEEEGYRVLEAANGEQALVLGHDEDPDVLLVDLRLPGIHGLDVVRSVRATSKVPITPARTPFSTESRPNDGPTVTF